MSVFLHRYSKSSIQKAAYQEASVKIITLMEWPTWNARETESKLKQVHKVKTKAHSDNSVWQFWLY